MLAQGPAPKNGLGIVRPIMSSTLSRDPNRIDYDYDLPPPGDGRHSTLHHTSRSANTSPTSPSRSVWRFWLLRRTGSLSVARAPQARAPWSILGSCFLRLGPDAPAGDAPEPPGAARLSVGITVRTRVSTMGARPFGECDLFDDRRPFDDRSIFADLQIDPPFAAGCAAPDTWSAGCLAIRARMRWR